MSTALGIVHEITTSETALDRVVSAARRLEEHEEVDRWEFAEDVREAVDEQTDDQNGFGHPDQHPHTKTGLYAAIDGVNAALADAGIISVGRSSIVGAYTTAKAWPEEERVEGATYWAHYELRGRDYDGRRQKALQRLVNRSQKGRVGPRDVRLWKSSIRPSDITPFLEKVERRVRVAIKSAAAPWAGVSETDRDAIGRMLKRIADEIQTGEFR